jgi:hypothetical protein
MSRSGNYPLSGMHYPLRPPSPLWLHSVASGTRCAREEIAALVERRKETMRQRRSVTQSPCHQVTLSPLPPTPSPPPPHPPYGAFGDIWDTDGN